VRKVLLVDAVPTVYFVTRHEGKSFFRASCFGTHDRFFRHEEVLLNGLDPLQLPSPVRAHVLGKIASTCVFWWVR
jgi:hypothetical protein